MNFELRTCVVLDRVQPQYAALTGSVIRGDMLVPGQAECYIEVNPGTAALPLLDYCLKIADVRPGFQIVEREFGVVEFHGTIENVTRAVSALFDHFGVDAAAVIRPSVVSTHVIPRVSEYQAQLINRSRHGSLLVPGEALAVLETEPAAYIVLAVNEAEKAVPIKVVDFDPVGRYGRMMLAGAYHDVTRALEVAASAVREYRGVFGG